MNIRMSASLWCVLCLLPSLACASESGLTRVSTGVVIPDRQVTLAAKIVGRIRSLSVAEGDAVEAGALLIDIEDAELRAALAAAKANLAQARVRKQQAQRLDERYQNLLRQKSISADQAEEAAFDHAAAAQGVNQALAEVARAEAQWNETKIRAPFAGVVVNQPAEVGQVTAPGEPLLTLEDQRVLKFRTGITEQDVPYISRGQAARVVVDALNDLTLEGKVDKLIPSGDQQTHEFTVEILLPPQQGLFPGMFGKARFGP